MTALVTMFSMWFALGVEKPWCCCWCCIRLWLLWISECLWFDKGVGG